MTVNRIAFVLGTCGLLVNAAGCMNAIGDQSPSEEISADELRGGRRGGGSGGGGYHCNPDLGVDIEAELISAEAISGQKVHLRAVPGSDESGAVTLTQYTFVSDDGVSLSIRPRVIQNCPGARVDDPYDFVVAGLNPETHYTVTAINVDACGNTEASSPLDFTTPPLVAESTPPTGSAPRLTRVSLFWSSMPGVVIFADDDTGVDYVEFFADGVSQGRHQYNGLEGFSPDIDGGEAYFTGFNADVRGTTANVEAHIHDVFGNVTVTSAMLDIPAS